MAEHKLTAVQAYLQKVAPLGGELSPAQREELKRLIAMEEGTVSPADAQDALQDALNFFQPNPR